MSDLVLSVKDLYKEYQNQFNPDALKPGVRGVSLDVSRGEVVGLIGESGCGKTTLGRCVTRLLDPDSGQILVNGKDFGSMRGEALRAFRKNVQVVFQRPETCLNPRMSVYQFVNEVFRNFHTCERGGEREKIKMFSNMVGLREDAIDFYPHQLSGGEKQRVAIMRALACDPSIIILDEPTSALDVSVQAQVLKTLKDLQRDVQTSFLFISHDVAVIRYMCSRVMVMYLGIIVEEGPADLVFDSPCHPYTRALLAAVPRLTAKDRTVDKLRGELIMNNVTASICPLLPRCPRAHDKCKTRPPMFDLEQGHRASCWLLE